MRLKTLEKLLIESFIEYYEYMKDVDSKNRVFRKDKVFKKTYYLFDETICTLSMRDVQRDFTDSHETTFDTYLIDCVSQLTGEVVTYHIEKSEGGIDMYRKI